MSVSSAIITSQNTDTSSHAFCPTYTGLGHQVMNSVLAAKAGGWAATVMNFISDTGHDPRDRLDLLLREQSTVRTSTALSADYRKLLRI